MTNLNLGIQPFVARLRAEDADDSGGVLITLTVEGVSDDVSYLKSVHGRTAQWIASVAYRYARSYCAAEVSGQQEAPSYLVSIVFDGQSLDAAYDCFCAIRDAIGRAQGVYQERMGRAAAVREARARGRAERERDRGRRARAARSD